MLASLNPLGFIAAAKARDAELFIGETQQLVSALGPTNVDLKPAVEALEAAKSLYAAQSYSKALAQAKRAASLATSLNDRFNAYLAAWKDLQACRDELDALGFPADSLEDALARADKAVVHRVEEAGTAVPDYLGATEMLERAVREARGLVAQARSTAHEILLASLAVEALSEDDPMGATNWLGVRLEPLIERATRELALGHLPAAHRLATQARSRADRARAGSARALESLEMTTAILDGLAATGRAADALRARIAAARSSLAQGFPDSASALAATRKISEDVAAFAKDYPVAKKDLDRVEEIYARLRRDGFCSYPVDHALAAARRRLEEGEWSMAREHVEHASSCFARLWEDQEKLGRAIAEIDERVGMLKGFRLPLLPEVEEILARAKAEVRRGHVAGAREDVLLAKAVMALATQTGS